MDGGRIKWITQALGANIRHPLENAKKSAINCVHTFFLVSQRSSIVLYGNIFESAVLWGKAFSSSQIETPVSTWRRQRVALHEEGKRRMYMKKAKGCCLFMWRTNPSGKKSRGSRNYSSTRRCTEILHVYLKCMVWNVCPQTVVVVVVVRAGTKKLPRIDLRFTCTISTLRVSLENARRRMTRMERWIALKWARSVVFTAAFVERAAARLGNRRWAMPYAAYRSVSIS